MTRATRQRRAAAKMEEAAMNLIYRAEWFMDSNPGSGERRCRRQCLLEAARAYASAVQRLRRA